MTHSVKKDFHNHVLKLQDLISGELRKIDPEIQLTEDHWERKDHFGNEGGGGRTRAFEGPIIYKTSKEFWPQIYSSFMHPKEFFL